MVPGRWRVLVFIKGISYVLTFRPAPGRPSAEPPSFSQGPWNASETKNKVSPSSPGDLGKRAHLLHMNCFILKHLNSFWLKAIIEQELPIV